MKKLFLIAFLAVGTSSFASSGKIVKPIKTKIESGCCSVGEFRACGGTGAENCNAARRAYCNVHPCTDKVLKTIQ